MLHGGLGTSTTSFRHGTDEGRMNICGGRVQYQQSIFLFGSRNQGEQGPTLAGTSLWL